MSDKNPPPWARRAGRGLRRLLGKVFGDRTVDRAGRRIGDSAGVLRDEFRKGREEAEAKDGDTAETARRVPHRDVDADSGKPGE